MGANNVLPRIVSFQLLANGRLDTSYQGNTFRIHRVKQVGVRYETLTGFWRYPDGKTFVYGFTRATLNGTSFPFLMRLKPNGTADSSFGQNGIFEYNFPGNNTATIRGMVTSANRLLLAGVYKQTNNSQSFPALYGFKANGGIDSTFGTNGIARLPYIPFNNNFLATDIKEDNQGRLWVSHYGYSDQSTFRVFAVGRFLSNGQPDPSYGNQGAVATNIPGSVQRLFLDPVDGLPIVTGDSPLSTIVNGTDMIAVKIRPDVTSVADRSTEGFSVFPNPAVSGDRIFFPGTSIEGIQIFDAQGSRPIPEKFNRNLPGFLLAPQVGSRVCTPSVFPKVGSQSRFPGSGCWWVVNLFRVGPSLPRVGGVTPDGNSLSRLQIQFPF